MNFAVEMETIEYNPCRKISHRMQQNPPESQSSANSTIARPCSKKGPHFLARICSELKRYKPLARWVALTLLLVSVMRSAANHFFPTSPTTQNLDLSKLL